MRKRIIVTKFRPRVGMMIRRRREKGSPWFYGSITQVDESGLIHMVGDDKKKHQLTSCDGRWMFDAGNLQLKWPPPPGTKTHE